MSAMSIVTNTYLYMYQSLFMSAMSIVTNKCFIKQQQRRMHNITHPIFSVSSTMLLTLSGYACSASSDNQQDQWTKVRPVTDGQLQPWSISHYLNKFRDQAGIGAPVPLLGRYRQAAGLAELTVPLEPKLSQGCCQTHGKHWTVINFMMVV